MKEQLKVNGLKKYNYLKLLKNNLSLCLKGKLSNEEFIEILIMATGMAYEKGWQDCYIEIKEKILEGEHL